MPSRAWAINWCSALFVARTQPWLIFLPMVHVCGVAWIATRSPPPQPWAIFAWWAVSARMQQP